MTSEPKDNAETKYVIILWNYLNWGGAQIYLLSIVKHAPKHWKFKIVIPRKSPTDIVELFIKHGVEIEYQDTWLDTGEAKTIFQKIKRQWRRIHSELVTYKYISRQNLKNTVLHIETAPWQSWILVKKLTNLTDVFVTMHNSLPPVSKLRQIIWKFRLLYVSKLNRFHLFTSNQDTKNSLIGWVSDNFWKRIDVTYTCVDPSEIENVLNINITKEELRKKYSIEPDKFVVLCVGQFIDRKGRKIFLEAANKLCDTNKNLQFLWLTQSDINDEAKNLIESYELGDAFRLVESKSVGKERAEILSFFRVADVFALPSFVEGLPIALLEAMALGIASISTNVNAIPEAVINDKTGILIEAGNSEQLALAINRIQADDKLKTRLAEKGRSLVIKQFDERVCAKIVLQNYQSALNK